MVQSLLPFVSSAVYQPFGQELHNADPAASVYLPAVEHATQWFDSEVCVAPVPALPRAH